MSRSSLRLLDVAAAGDLRRRRPRALLPLVRAGRAARARRSSTCTGSRATAAGTSRPRPSSRGAATRCTCPTGAARARASRPRGDFERPAQLVADVRRFVAARARASIPRARRRPRRRLLGRAAGARVRARAPVRARRARARRAGAQGQGRPARRRRSCASSPAASLEPERRIRIPLEAELFTREPAVPRVRPDRPAQPARGHRALLLPAVLLGPAACSRSTSCRCRVLAAPGRATTRSSTASASGAGSSGCASPRQALPRYADFGHILDFEEERQRYWDDVAGWLDEVSAQPAVARRAVARTPAVAAIDVLTAELPFRFSFGHALAARDSSTNVVTRVVLDDGTVGYGEGVPREYVTGETVDCAVSAALTERLVPALLGGSIRRRPTTCRRARRGRAADRARRVAADGCALRARAGAARRVRPALRLLGAALARQRAARPWSIRRRAAVLVAAKVVVLALRDPGARLPAGEDQGRRRPRQRAALARAAAPPARAGRRPAGRRELRLDGRRGARRRSRACATTASAPSSSRSPATTSRACAASPRRSRRRSIVDESLRTVEEARSARRAERLRRVQHPRLQVRRAARRRSRSPGSRASAGLATVVGAQVGESGILSAAGRHLAAAIVAPRYVEGSGGRLLLREDLTAENVLPGLRRLGAHVHRPRPRRPRPRARARAAHAAPAARSPPRRGRRLMAHDVARRSRCSGAWLKFSAANHFDDATWDPRAAQERKLLDDRPAQPGDRLRARARLRPHPLDRATSSQRVPPNTYETLEPYIERTLRGETNVLTADKPLMFATTSGTTGAAKYIPVTPSYLHEYSHGVHVHTYRMFADFRDILDGQVARPVVERRRGPHRGRPPVRRHLGLPHEHAAGRDQALLRAPLRALPR